MAWTEAQLNNHLSREQKNLWNARQTILRLDIGTELELISGQKVVKLKNYRGKIRCKLGQQVRDFKVERFKLYRIILKLQ